MTKRTAWAVLSLLIIAASGFASAQKSTGCSTTGTPAGFTLLGVLNPVNVNTGAAKHP